MDNVLIWGTGKEAIKLIKNKINGEIIGFIETYKRQDYFMNKKVYNCAEIPNEYDAIIVANHHSNEIYLTMKNYYIDVNKVIFLFPCAYIKPCENIEWINRILGEANFQQYLGAFGFYSQTFYEHDKQLYKSLNKRETFAIHEDNVRPIINDKFDYAGNISNYFWQDLWAARLVYNDMPDVHYDIGSRLDGFISHLLVSKIPVKIIDIRPFPTEIEGLTTIVDDATSLRQFEDNSISSLSALCSLEHFGLGRYGDPIDPEACFKCFEQIQRKMKSKGNLYISLPIGRERVEFNAHRIFYARTIVDCFSQMHLVEYSCTAEGQIEYHVQLEKYDEDAHQGDYRYGLFHFIKN